MSIDGEAQPFVKWVGGKRSLLPVILPLLPDSFENYFEPFAGGGALYFALAPGLKKATLVDRNLELVLAYQSIKKQPGALLARLKAHAGNHDKDYYYRVRKQKPIAPIEVAARFLYLNKTCFNGLYRVNNAGGFNAPMGSYRNPNIVPVDNIRACHRTYRTPTFCSGTS
jgi:DNA adenine methylase